MLSEEQKAEVRDWFVDDSKSITLKVSDGGDDGDLERDLLKLAEELTEIAPPIRLEREQAVDGRSGMEISGPGGEGVIYAALPVQGEWAPFFQTLQAAADSAAVRQPILPKEIFAATLSGRMEVFMTPQCPYCPGAVGLVNRVVLRQHGLRVWVINAAWDLELAREAGVRATPTILIDGQPRWVGKLAGADLHKLFAKSDQWETTLRSQLDAGSVEDCLEMLIRHKEARAALPRLLREPEVGLHVAVLRVIEDYVARDPSGACTMARPLCELLTHESPQTRGDAAYALGILGDKSAMDALRNCCDDEDEDVRETAEEALEMLGAK